MWDVGEEGTAVNSWPSLLGVMWIMWRPVTTHQHHIHHPISQSIAKKQKPQTQTNPKPLSFTNNIQPPSQQEKSH
jgi:hypothetical protein